MAGSVYEPDLLLRKPLSEKCESTYVLRDVPEFLFCPLRVTEGIQQRSLAMVDVAHDSDDGGALAEDLVGFLLLIHLEKNWTAELLADALNYWTR